MSTPINPNQPQQRQPQGAPSGPPQMQGAPTGRPGMQPLYAGGRGGGVGRAGHHHLGGARGLQGQCDLARRGARSDPAPVTTAMLLVLMGFAPMVCGCCGQAPTYLLKSGARFSAKAVAPSSPSGEWVKRSSALIARLERPA